MAKKKAKRSYKKISAFEKANKEYTLALKYTKNYKKHYRLAILNRLEHIWDAKDKATHTELKKEIARINKLTSKSKGRSWALKLPKNVKRYIGTLEDKYKNLYNTTDNDDGDWNEMAGGLREALRKAGVDVDDVLQVESVLGVKGLTFDEVLDIWGTKLERDFEKLFYPKRRKKKKIKGKQVEVVEFEPKYFLQRLKALIKKTERYAESKEYKEGMERASRLIVKGVVE